MFIDETADEKATMSLALSGSTESAVPNKKDKMGGTSNLGNPVQRKSGQRHLN